MSNNINEIFKRNEMKKRYLVRRIGEENMLIKKQLEQEYIELYTKRLDEKSNDFDSRINQLQDKILLIDNTVSALIQEQDAFYNQTWGRIFRAGAEESYFAYQVDRYACIYMEKLIELFDCSPLSYFRAHRRSLAHDDAIAHEKRDF